MSVRQVAAEAGVSHQTAQRAMVSHKTDSLPKKCDTIADESAASGLSEATIARQRRLKADHPDRRPARPVWQMYTPSFQARIWGQKHK